MRMMIAGLGLLAGCASTPTELREDAPRFEFTLKQPPANAAPCLARNAENHAGGTTTTTRAVGSSYEVIVSGNNGAFAVADVRPAGGGSAATIYRHSIPLHPFGLPEAMAKGC